MKREFRVFKGANLRATDPEKRGIDGYAAVFSQVTELYSFGGYTVKEQIKPGAFTRAIAEKQDVRCLFNHDESLVLGRTKSGTLRLAEDEQGLKFDCDTPDTQAARDARTLIERGDVDQCSFGFIVKKQTRTETDLEDGTCEVMRVIEDVDLFDVSPVTYPAYEGTSCEARELRSMFPDGLPEGLPEPEQRTSDCECDCPECEDGDCANCSNAECDDSNCKGGGDRCKHTARSRQPGEPPVPPAEPAATPPENSEIELREYRLRAINASL